jgi:hypothetical protein
LECGGLPPLFLGEACLACNFDRAAVGALLAAPGFDFLKIAFG